MVQRTVGVDRLGDSDCEGVELSSKLGGTVSCQVYQYIRKIKMNYVEFE